jgi:hypothetical protein
MDFRFGDVHLDPGCDPPQVYETAFNVFCELWGRLQEFRTLCREDRVLLALVEHAQRELIVVAMILKAYGSGPR